MPVSGVLTSCATPAASRPIAAIFSDSRSCSSRFARSVMSSMTMIQPACAPSGVWNGAIAGVDEQRRACVAVRRRRAARDRASCPRGDSRRAATSVSTNGRLNSAAEPAARAPGRGRRRRALPARRFQRSTRSSRSTTTSAVGERLDDAVAELAEPLDLVRLAAAAGCRAARSRSPWPPGRRPRASSVMSSLLSGSPCGAAADGEHRDRQSPFETHGTKLNSPASRQRAASSPDSRRAGTGSSIDDRLPVDQPRAERRRRLDRRHGAAVEAARRARPRTGPPRRADPAGTARSDRCPASRARARRAACSAGRDRDRCSDRARSSRARGGSRSDRGSRGDRAPPESAFHSHGATSATTSVASSAQKLLLLLVGARARSSTSRSVPP